MSENIITIGGRSYDAHTGLMVDTPAHMQPSAPALSTPVLSPVQVKKIHHAASMHATTQKSQTLYRRATKKPVQPVKQVVSSVTKQVSRPMTQPKSAAVTKFAPHPATVKVKKPVSSQRVMSDIGPRVHPMVQKAHAQQNQAVKRPSAIAQPTVHSVAQTRQNAHLHTAKQQTPIIKPSQVIKHEAVTKALENAPTKKDLESNHKKAKKSLFKRRPRLAGIMSASVGLLLLGGYFTYLNMPNISVRVAAAQAGINATYPEYHPDGYSLSGPVAFSDGQVSMKFAANTGSQNFTVKQSKSSWDSVALLDNYVKKQAGNSYTTYSDRGLTIYTYDGNAAWVNGGIMYTINGDAPLSSDQVLRIASSL